MWDCTPPDPLWPFCMPCKRSLKGDNLYVLLASLGSPSRQNYEAVGISQHAAQL